MFLLPTDIADFVHITEVADGNWLVNDLFQHKFGHPAPRVGHHVIAFVQEQDTRLRVASYLHFWRKETIGFIGGGSTDGRVIRALDQRQSSLINLHGGLLRHTLLYAFWHFATDGLEAFFGHCGDARAKSVDLAAGFQETEHENLLVKWAQPLAIERQNVLIESALSVGAF